MSECQYCSDDDAKCVRGNCATCCVCGCRISRPDLPIDEKFREVHELDAPTNATVEVVGIEYPSGHRIVSASDERCTLPPPGWKCTRGKHDGPCAALPDVASATRIRISGRPEDPTSLRIVAVRGDAEMPLDVDALAIDLDVHGGRLSMSWPACAIEMDIDVRPLSPDERFDQVRVMLEEAIAECEEHNAEYHHETTRMKIEEWKMWLKLHDLGRR